MLLGSVYRTLLSQYIAMYIRSILDGRVSTIAMVMNTRNRKSTKPMAHSNIAAESYCPSNWGMATILLQLHYYILEASIYPAINWIE